MVSARSWQQAVAESRGKCALTARDLYTAEKTAYVAYDRRVRELAQSGGGVPAHDGLNNRMVLSNAISLLAIGDERGFRESVEHFAERAAWDPHHYSALSYGLQAVDGFLKTRGRA